MADQHWALSELKHVVVLGVSKFAHVVVEVEEEEKQRMRLWVCAGSEILLV